MTRILFLWSTGKSFNYAENEMDQGRVIMAIIIVALALFIVVDKARAQYIPPIPPIGTTKCEPVTIVDPGTGQTRILWVCK